MASPALIVTDMDGTLLRSDKTISEFTRRTMADARRAGAVLALASGRPPVGLLGLLRRLDIDPTGVVLFGLNGSVVVSAETGETLVDSPIPAADYRDLITHAQRFDVSLMVPTQDRLYVRDATDPFVEHEKDANGEELVELTDLRDLPAPAYKVLMAGPAPYLAEHHEALAAPFAGRFEFSFSMPIYFEATRAGTDKGSAVVAYCRQAGIDLADVVAFGDNHNDLPMLRSAGTGVAMANAVPEARAVARQVTSRTNDDDGLAHHLRERYGFGQW